MEIADFSHFPCHYFLVLSLLLGWLLDWLFGDPVCLPHPIVWFGKAIAWCEHRLNQGSYRKAKGGMTAVALIAAT